MPLCEYGEYFVFNEIIKITNINETRMLEMVMLHYNGHAQEYNLFYVIK